MNKKIILSIIVCTLMFVTIFPVTGLPVHTEKMIALKTKLNFLEGATHCAFSAPGPGEMSRPYPTFESGKTTSIGRPHVVKSVSRTSDFVVDLIQQVDEAKVLGYLQNLTAFGPRLTGSPACRSAATYIYNQFKGMGLTVRYDNWSSSGYSGSNIEATLPGTDVTSDEIYIICGHYDTVSVSPGADDDGSGTVATIIAALLMSQYTFHNTIRFVTFSGEEQGLLGSAVYAAEAHAHGDNIVGVLNADMIGYAVTHNDGSQLIVFEDDASEWMYTYMVNIENLYHDYIDLSLVHGGWTWGSDHNSFWDEGYNAVFTFEFTETPYYHTSGDTIAHMNISYATKNTKLLVATLAELTIPSQSTPPNPPTITGPTLGGIGTEYTYNVVTTDPDGDDVSYFIDWGDNTSSGWLGPYASGTALSIGHTWTSPGTYQVRAQAQDIFHVTSNWSAPLTVVILNDHAPNTPTISGSLHGIAGIPYLYKFETTDLDGDNISYFVDWGDGNNSGWLGPYASGTQIQIRHKWTTQGSYTIKVKAKDPLGLESNWGTLPISMPTFTPSSESTPLNSNQNTAHQNTAPLHQQMARTNI